MQRLPIGPDITPTPLFNPSLDELEYKHDGKTYTLPAYGIETYPKYLADRIAHRLVDTVLSKRGVRKNYELDKEELLKEIYVK